MVGDGGAMMMNYYFEIYCSYAPSTAAVGPIARIGWKWWQCCQEMVFFSMRTSGMYRVLLSSLQQQRYHHCGSCYDSWCHDKACYYPLGYCLLQSQKLHAA